jgi:hypothetical protein
MSSQLISLVTPFVLYALCEREAPLVKDTIFARRQIRLELVRRGRTLLLAILSFRGVMLRSAPVSIVRMTRPATPMLMMAGCLSIAAIRPPVPAKHIPKQTPCPPHSSDWVAESLCSPPLYRARRSADHVGSFRSLLLCFSSHRLLSSQATSPRSRGPPTHRRPLPPTASKYAEDWDL